MIEKSIKHIEDRIKFSDLRPEIVIKKESAEAVLSELETYKKIAKRLAKEILLQYPEMFNMVTVNNMEILIESARKEVENEQK